jgi:coenzyme F420-reducing hydrogenase alpha subunit
LYCGEWIESHSLHMFLLHVPDFLGYPDAVAMAKDHPDVVKRGLRMKKAGNAIMELLGGRSIHPISVRVGGFTRVPSRTELATLLPELDWGRQAARASLAWLAGLPFPELERDYELVALQHPDEYAMCEGRLASSKGLAIDVPAYDAHFAETQVEGSNALTSRRVDAGAYLCGPLARFQIESIGSVRRTAFVHIAEVSFIQISYPHPVRIIAA